MRLTTHDLGHQLVAGTSLAVAVVVVPANDSHLMRRGLITQELGSLTSPERRDVWLD
jgi:hypothetical protein